MATLLQKPHVITVKDSEENEDPSDLQEESEDNEEADNVSNEGTEEESEDGGGGDEGSDEDDDDDDCETAGDITEQNGDADENPNAGWAEAMAKILGKKTPTDKPCILLKNKQREKLRAKEKKEQLERKKQADTKRTWEMMCRAKPNIVQDKEKERNFQRTATRGVVQLFNAVRQHQHKVDEKLKSAGGSERKKSKVLSSITKKDFIDVLRGSAGCKPSTKNVKSEQEEKKPAWSVLKDDFMMGSTMKDWDKESDAEAEEEKTEPAADFSSDSD